MKPKDHMNVMTHVAYNTAEFMHLQV